jgi:hypothetical protein
MTRRGPLTFDDVRAAAAGLAGITHVEYYGKPALKVGGTMFVCLASHRSAEPNSLVVRMDFDLREALLAEQPDVYYVTDHYIGYSSVLVRLSRVTLAALEDLVASAYRFVVSTRGVKRRGPRRPAGAAAPPRGTMRRRVPRDSRTR